MSSNSNEGGSTNDIMEELKKDMLAADLRLSLFAGRVPMGSTLIEISKDRLLMKVYIFLEF